MTVDALATPSHLEDGTMQPIKTTLFKLLKRADRIKVDACEVEVNCLDHTFYPDLTPVALLTDILDEDGYYYFADQEVTLLNGECRALTTEDPDQDYEPMQRRMRFTLERPLTLADLEN